MRREFILDDKELGVIKRIVRQAIAENNRQVRKGIAGADLLFNMQELAQAEIFLGLGDKQ